MVSATVVYTACQWLTVVFLSRFTSVEVLGTYALALAIVTPVWALTNMQLRYVLCSDAKEEFSFGNYLFIRIATIVLSLAGICLWSTGQQFGIFAVILVLALGKGSDALCDILHGYLQAHGRMDRIAISLMLQGPLQLAFFASVTMITGQLVFGIVAAALVSISICLGFDLKNVRRVQPDIELVAEIVPLCRLSRQSWTKVKKLIWLGFPLGLVMGMSSLNGNLPRYLLASSHGQAAVGIFAALYYLTLPAGIVVSAYCDSAMPQFARWGAEGNSRQLSKILIYLVAAAAILGSAGWLGAWGVGKSVLLLCYGKQYAANASSLNWLMAGAGFLYITTVLGYAITALREFHLQVPLRMFNLLVAYVICLYLIPNEGLLGAAKALFVSSVVFAITTAALLWIVLRRKTPFAKSAPLASPSFSAEAELRGA